MFESKMVTPAIPERVYALCKIVEKNPITNAEAKEKLEPSYLNQESSYYNDYRQAAEEMQLITTIDNTLTLTVDSSVIKSIETMRAYINRQLYRFPEGQFYKVTREYFAMGENILYGEQNVANMASAISKKVKMPVDNMAMRGWRFWASFLGFGYLVKMFLMPNADIFLLDLINESDFIKGQRYSVDEFINLMRPHSDIIIDPSLSGNVFNFGVSNGLRTLQDQGYIKLENIMDQKNVWNLHHIDALGPNDVVTNITILK